MPSFQPSRRHIRFPAAPDTIARLDFRCEHPFAPTLNVPVVNESFAGCRIRLDDPHPQVLAEAKLWIQVGKIDVLPAEIRWAAIHDDGSQQAGIAYQDPPHLTRQARSGGETT